MTTKTKSPAQYVREVRQEASKITWPTRKETTVTTIMVFIMVFLASMFLFFADQVIARVVGWVI